MSLFKYAKPARFADLSSLTIRFSPISEFNDPFESLPGLSIFADPKRVEQYNRNIVSRVVQQAKLAAAREGRTTTATLEKVMEALNSRYPDHLSEFRTEVMPVMKKAVSHFRILSLSRVEPTSPDALLLWGHYAERHKGLVFEFDEKHT